MGPPGVHFGSTWGPRIPHPTANFSKPQSGLAFPRDAPLPTTPLLSHQNHYLLLDQRFSDYISKWGHRELVFHILLRSRRDTVCKLSLSMHLALEARPSVLCLNRFCNGFVTSAFVDSFVSLCLFLFLSRGGFYGGYALKRAILPHTKHSASSIYSKLFYFSYSSLVRR